MLLLHFSPHGDRSSRKGGRHSTGEHGGNAPQGSSPAGLLWSDFAPVWGDFAPPFLAASLLHERGRVLAGSSLVIAITYSLFIFVR